MTIKKKQVAIIGLENIGAVIAKNLVKSNRPVILADKTFQKAMDFSLSLGEIAEPKSIINAIKKADILILSIPFNKIKDLFKTYDSELTGKIIIDPSNPIAKDANGVYRKMINNNQSAGEILAVLKPKGSKFVKALGTLTEQSLENAAFQKPNRAVEFYATDSPDIINIIDELILDNGFDPFYLGGIDQSIRIETFGDLHEIGGGFGKTITLSEIRRKR